MIIFFGPAGSGKSLQGQILAARQEWSWLSTGQMLRESKDMELVKIMQSGKLVSNEKMNKIVGETLAGMPDTNKIILDGFPRQIDQARWMIDNNILHGHSTDLIVIVDVPKEALIKRLKGRGRADDTPEAIEERLRVYNQETSLMLDYFAKQAINIIHIDGSGKVGQIHDKLMEELSACKLV